MLKSCLMVQGTSSDAGKTTLVAGLCRVLARCQEQVAPFKPQNMALNSAVADSLVEGKDGEIGRAQALQAQACKIKAHTDMNPVLIKPASDIGAQIIIHGQPLEDMDAKAFHAYKPLAQNAVMESFARLSQRFAYIVVEGAGSPAEINLREGDIANMGFAEAVDCPVILVADIDRGGVFAQIVGTLALLSQSEQNRVIGFVINKFRGDIALLQSGLDWLEARTGKPVFGVLPYLHDFYIDSEDSIDTRQRAHPSDERFRIVVPVLPRISNHTDFDSLRLHPDVDLRFVSCTQPPPSADLIILPGSKNVRADLTTLLESGWQHYLHRHLRFGGKLLGICGGFQMLGTRICDPLGVEGPAGSCDGFGFIAMETEFMREKTLRKKTGQLNLAGYEAKVEGYEIHHGRSELPPTLSPLLSFEDGTQDGFIDESQQILGAYLHGIFDSPEALDALLGWAGLSKRESPNIALIREQALNRLADTLEQHMDLPALFRAAFGCEYAPPAAILETPREPKQSL